MNLLKKEAFEQFEQWFNHAKDNETAIDHTAVNLATSNREGWPSNRTVFVKQFDLEGFHFFTNYQSQKGQDLTQNPKASLCFFYPSQQRQIRIVGLVEKLSPQQSDDYFYARSLGSQLASSLSYQSRVMEDEALANQTLQHQLAQKKPAHRPAHWGGFRLRPNWFEFWQAGEFRWHQRICYRQVTRGEDDRWEKIRLYP